MTVQNPVRLNQYNEPQPDLVLAKHRPDYYDKKHPTPEDTLLVLEVSDTTLAKDQKLKLPVYARLGIVEVWIEDLQHDRILVFRDPGGNRYKTSLMLHRGDSVFTLAFPEISFNVEDLLG